jgi:hypothetical protein
MTNLMFIGSQKELSAFGRHAGSEADNLNAGRR